MLYDEHVSFLLLDIDAPSLRVQFTDALCYILVVFGLIGNLLGLFIFSSSRRTWRISSVYVYLATGSSIINFLCVIRYASILHSKSRYILCALVGEIWFACKFYEFSFCLRVISSWITLFWMFERFMCVSKRLRLLSHRWNISQFKFIIPILIILVILTCVLGPPLYMYQPQISSNTSINSTDNTIRAFCGLDSTASIKWQKYFHDIHFGANHHTIRCLISELIPAGAIILFNSYIIYHLTQTFRRFSGININKRQNERRQTTSWMNIVLILHSLLFLLSLLSHIVGHFMSIEAHETWWVLLAILANCSLNFYVYCLSGKTFRQEINRFIQRLTTFFSYKLQTRLQHRENFKEMDLIYQCYQFPIADQVKTYRPANNRGSIPMNSSFKISEEKASM